MTPQMKTRTALSLVLLTACALPLAARPGDNGDRWWGHGDHDRNHHAALRMDSTQNGNGSIRESGKSDRSLHSVRVNLNPGGQAIIVLNGDHDQQTFTGSWQPADNDGNVPLGLTGAFGRAPVNVGGSVNLRLRDPGKFDRLSLSGKAGRHGLTIRFTAK